MTAKPVPGASAQAAVKRFERIRANRETHPTPLSEDEALLIAAEEKAAMRAEQRSKNS